MTTPNFFQFKVRCPRPGSFWEELLTLKYIKANEGIVPVWHKECDYMDGSPLCRRCKLAVSEEILKKIDEDPGILLHSDMVIHLTKEEIE